MKNIGYISVAFLLFMFWSFEGNSQDFTINFGNETTLNDIASGSKKSTPVKWINVNTNKDTWEKKGKILKCSGQPIGVIRSEKQYENFILHVEWSFAEPGGNSGVFVWSGANPPEGKQLPDGVEVQMLDIDYFKVNTGSRIPEANRNYYVHGHLFGVGGVETVPDNPLPNSNRSNPVEFRVVESGKWNTYQVVCVDGVIKLSVNGKVVNGVSKSSQRKGYICLESEGAEIHFRNLKIIELPGGVISQNQIAPLL
jgi:hypothetical protein